MIRHNSLQSIALSAIALLAAAGGPAHAGAKKTAIKTLKASTAHIAKEVKKDAKLARLDLFSALDDTEHDVAQGLITGEDGALDVFIALAILQHQLGGIQEEATEDIRLAVDQATDILVDGGVLVPDYPAGFHHGDGGATDKLRAQIGKELGKVYMSVEKRLAKTRSVFEKKVHRALSCRLSPVNTYVERAGLGPHTDPVPLTIDVAVATSDLATANDVTTTSPARATRSTAASASCGPTSSAARQSRRSTPRSGTAGRRR